MKNLDGTEIICIWIKMIDDISKHKNIILRTAWLDMAG